MGTPLISVVMPARDGASWIGAAVESILRQSYTDFEFIIVDDGSTDASPEIVAGYADPRLRLVRRPHRGLVASLNEGIALARGRYVVRQDADDVSLPQRLARQVAYLEAHPEVALVGSNGVRLDCMGRRIGRSWLDGEDTAIRWQLLFGNHFLHTAVAARRGAILAAGGYAASERHAEDYGLWSRIVRHGRLANLAEPLVGVREHSAGVTARHRREMRDAAVRISAANLAELVGKGADPQALNYLAGIAWEPLPADPLCGDEAEARALVQALAVFLDAALARFCEAHRLPPERRRGLRRRAFADLARWILGRAASLRRHADPQHRPRLPSIAASLFELVRRQPDLLVDPRWWRPAGRMAVEVYARAVGGAAA